ncbi:MAG: tRNA preQ1(34) S-adenosylmethionine ribosyltransferase-isomerase QueA [Candidatus Paceibacterota bacterium]|jgi:S-adenosylmethionine:tRNA ribosyltransferase-isomerase
MTPKDYDYNLPKELVAQKPAEPRDSARLMIYDTKTGSVSFDVFRNIGKYLPTPALLVFNDTRVLPARMFALDSEGVQREILVLVNEVVSEYSFLALVRGKTQIGDVFTLTGERFEVIKVEEKVVTLNTSLSKVELEKFLEKYGTTPLPPYIKDHQMKEDELRLRYQTVFSANGRAAAAPTASLHFTEEVLESLHKKGLEKTFVTLNVGLGTFAPITEENVKEKKLHKEYLEVFSSSSEKIRSAKESSIPVVAVGTTVVRTLESASEEILSGKESLKETDLFIQPGFDFKVVDHLITNFHVPKSSLLMLVDAFLAHKKAKRGILELYEEAKKEKMRFFSFGDSMLIL